MEEVTVRNDPLFIGELKVDGSGKTDIIDTCEVPVIHIGTTNNKEVCNTVQFVEFQTDEETKDNNGVVTLLEGTKWFKLPISEVKLSNPESDENLIEVIQSGDEPDSIEISTSNESDSTVVILEDGRIAYVQQIYGEESNDHEIENYDGKEESKEENSKLVKKPKGRKHVCPVVGCYRAYTSLHHLKVHSRNHTGDRPYKCLIEGCLKAFATDYSRKAHIRTHTGEKPYTCPSAFCSKGFKTSGDLQKHIRVHTGERPFVCPIKGCNRSFTTSNIRKVHIRTHTGEKPYVCTQDGCSRSFASSTNFKNHMRIHSGEKPYVCSVDNCLKRFTEYSSLYKHQLVHSQVKKHCCPFCHKTYRQSSTLTTHKRTVHGVISADDGTEIILEQMIGLGEDGSKNFKNITSKLLNLKRGHGTIVTMEDDAIGSAPLYIVSQVGEEDFDEVEAELAE